MKKLIMLAMVIVAAISPGLCSAQGIFSDEIINKKGVKLVKFSPWMLKTGLKGKEDRLKRQGIEELTAFEFISAAPWAFYDSQDKTLYPTLVSDIDKAVKDMKLVSVMEVRDGKEKVDLLVNPVPGEESKVDIFVIKIEKKEEISVLGMKGLFDLTKLINNNPLIKDGMFKVDGLMNIL